MMTGTTPAARPLVRAFVGLGSNLADPRRQVEAALVALDALPDTRVSARSRLYLSAPWGRAGQPDFVNAVAQIDTGLGARALLDALLAIEKSFGRSREGERWGPRIIDLDLLLHGAQVIDEPSLKLPHPRMSERAFVLLPLAELAAGLEVPGTGRVEDLVERVDTRECGLL